MRKSANNPARRSVARRFLLMFVLLGLTLSSLGSNLKPSVIAQAASPRRVLVLLQGLGTNSDSAFCTWFDLKREIKSAGIYNEIIEFSYVGSGQAYTAEDTYKPIQQSVDVLRDTLDQYLSIPGHETTQFDLVGHSLGGVVAWRYAFKYGLEPDRSDHLFHVVSMDSPVNGSTWLDILNEDVSQTPSPEGLQQLETLWGGLHSPAAVELGSWHQKQTDMVRNNIAVAKLLKNAGVMVATFTSDADWAIPPSDALIPGFDWNDDLGTGGLFSKCGREPTRRLDMANLLGHSQILHRDGSLEVLRAFLQFSSFEPIGARFIRQSGFLVLKPGESSEIFFDVQNIGDVAWTPGGRFLLENINDETLGARSQYELAVEVPVGQVTRWVVPITAPEEVGAYISEWQLSSDGVRFGPAMSGLILVMPEGDSDIVGTLKQWFKDLIADLIDQIARLLEDLARLIVDTLLQALEQLWLAFWEGLVQQFCGVAVVAPLALLSGSWGIKRWRRRMVRSDENG